MQPPPHEGSGWYEDDGRGTPCVPYPNAILAISGNRRLNLSGVILTDDDREWHFGEPVNVTSRTRAYWEGRAAVAGHTLDELLEQTAPTTGPNE
jgi:hypothetical protein